MGLQGEKLVLKYEKNYLKQHEKRELAEKVKHTSKIEGDGAGYDIHSYTTEREDKYIEVKTTKGNKGTPFYISLNELNFSKKYLNSYYLYRVYNFDKENNSGEFYVLKGNIKNNFTLEPIKFKVKK